MKNFKRLGFLIFFLIFWGTALPLLAEEASPSQNQQSQAAASETVQDAAAEAAAKETPTETKQKLEEIKKKEAETKEAIKARTEHIEKVKEKAEVIKKQKEEIEKRAEEKAEQAEAVKKELAAVKEKAVVTQNPEAIQKAQVLETKAEQLEHEAKTEKKRLQAAEAKTQAAEKTVAMHEKSIEMLNAELTKLRKEKSLRRSLIEKLIWSAVYAAIGLAMFMVLIFTLNRFVRWLTPKDVIRESEQILRLKTIVALFRWIGSIAIMVFVVYAILGMFGIDMAPLLAGAGIVGLAFGFGGQYLIRDIINGIFILIEGQYRINDVVKIGDLGGLVESVNLRVTRLRDLEGRVIYIPNGEVKTVINYTKEYAQALLDIGVAYKENVDHVMTVMKSVAAEMRRDPYFGRLILSDMEMLGLDDFADSAVIIKCRIRTLPIKQWEVSREYRRRLKNKFDELGIEIPFPHRTLYWGSGEDNAFWKAHFTK